MPLELYSAISRFKKIYFVTPLEGLLREGCEMLNYSRGISDGYWYC